MPFTRSGTEYGYIDQMLATSAFGPNSGRLKKLRKELAQEQIRADEQEITENQRQQKRSEQLADYKAKVDYQADLERRKKRLLQSGM